MGRRRTKLRLGPSQHAELVRQWRVATAARDRERLQVVRRASGGSHTLDDLARLAGRSRSTVQVWLDKYARGGINGLLERDTPPGSTSPISAAKVQTQLQAGLKAGRWRTASEVAAWLKDAHGIERSRKSLYYWLNNHGGNAASAAPRQHSKRSELRGRVPGNSRAGTNRA